MGLFSSLRAGLQSTNTDEVAARALLSVSFITAASDGNLDQREMDQLLNMCAFSPVFLSVGAKRTLDIAKEVMNDLQKKGAEAVFAAAQANMSPQLAETAVCFAVRTALADGSIDKNELETLKAIGMRLGVPAETFVKIFEVLSMLQRRAA
jgi:tellurite resistance protein